MLSAIGLCSYILLAKPSSGSFRNTDRINFDDGLCLKQLARWSSLPFSISIRKLQTCQMPADTGHGDRTIAPLCKVEIEFIVLDISMITNISLPAILELFTAIFSYLRS